MNARRHARRTACLVTLAVVAAVVAAGPAGAVVSVEGTGEPAFTRSTTNTQWVSWKGSPSYETYRLEFDRHVGASPAGTETTGNLPPNGEGTTWVNWGGVLGTLAEGTTYGICTYGRYTIGGVGARDTGSCADPSGKRASTTIDLTKPSIAVAIDGGQPWSRTAKLAYRIDYSDNLAFPFPANFVCRDVGTDPAQACAGTTHEFNAACSVPVGGMKKTTHFTCTEDLSTQGADGPVTFCVVSADAAVPDNPNSSNQSGSAAQANLSARTCDSITLDRTAPAVSVQTGATTVVAGDPVNFSAQASDATSGLAGHYAWSWGDSTPDGAGVAASHTFAAPGTYEVRLRTTDNAGNEATATKVVTVTARPAGGGDTATPPAQGPTASAPVGGGGAPLGRGLEVAAPKRLKATRRPTLALALIAQTPGRAQVALLRAGRVHATGAVVVRRAGTVGYRLKVPRRLRTGAYVLKVSWSPAGATTAQTTSLKLEVVSARSARRRPAAARAAVRTPLVSAAGAPRAVPDGRAPAGPSSRAVRLPLG